MIDIDANNVTEANLHYLNHICKNDFYKNDKEYIKIVKKLTEQSVDISNKALNLAIILSEAEKIKFDMVQKEIALGLSQKDKPYGLKSNTTSNHTMVYYAQTDNKIVISRFIENLEKYFSIFDPVEKKDLLNSIKEDSNFLEKRGENPKKFIITPQRSKVWHIIEHSFTKTMKKIDIDLFISKIKLLRIKYQDKIDDIYNYYQMQEKIFKEIAAARESDNTQLIPQLKNRLSMKISANVSPLLIDTGKVIKEINFLLEDIPDEIDTEQKKEIEKFLPAISEYYIDQTYGLSGGYSYTDVENKLKEIQKLINQQKSVKEILEKVDLLDASIQHLYILHWIAESLLKDIMKCFTHDCTIGRVIPKYHGKFRETHINKNYIMSAIYIRNDIAHNALIWEPKKLRNAITIYREYINLLASEQNIELERFKIPRINREMTQEDKDLKTNEILREKLQMDRQELKKIDDKILNVVIQTIESRTWDLDEEQLTLLKQKVQNAQWIKARKEKDEFALKYFNMPYNQIENRLKEKALEQNPLLTFTHEEEQKIAKLNRLYWCFKNTNHEAFDKNIQELKKEIGVTNG